MSSAFATLVKLLKEGGAIMTFSAWCISGLVPDCACSRCLRDQGLVPTEKTEAAAEIRSRRESALLHERTRQFLREQGLLKVKPKRQYVTLHGRRSLVVMHGERRGIVVRWTQACSGCVPDEEGVFHAKGDGCQNCGYTGKRRRVEWVPLDETPTEEMKEGRESNGG